jgi:hypothetical protein
VLIVAYSEGRSFTVVLNVIVLIVIMLSVIVLIVIMLIIVMLSVIVLIVIMLIVVAPFHRPLTFLKRQLSSNFSLRVL